MWGLLFGTGFFWVPGVGPFVVGGPLVAYFVGALETTAVTGGMSALGAAIFCIGIPKDSVVEYESSIQAGKFLVMVHGNQNELKKAKATLSQTHAASVNHHVAA